LQFEFECNFKYLILRIFIQQTNIVDNIKQYKPNVSNNYSTDKINQHEDHTKFRYVLGP